MNKEIQILNFQLNCSNFIRNNHYCMNLRNIKLQEEREKKIHLSNAQKSQYFFKNLDKKYLYNFICKICKRRTATLEDYMNNLATFIKYKISALKLC